MEREPLREVADAAAAPAVEGDQPAPKKESSGKGGEVPAVHAEHAPGAERSASELAYEGDKKPPGPKELQAERDTKKVLEFIRNQAKARAAAGGAIGPDNL